MADTMLDLLNEVVRLSSELHSQVADFQVCNGQNEIVSQGTALPHLEFSIPNRMIVCDIFATSGAPRSIVDEFTSIHCDRASDLATAYAELYSQTCLELHRLGCHTSSSTLRRLAKRLQEMFRSTEKSWMQEKLATMKPLMKQPELLSRSRSSFNMDFIPLLEAFYCKNSRPSRADKVFLAQQAEMSYRQIDVWFQNKRRRSKRKTVSVNSRNCTVDTPLLTAKQESSEAVTWESEATEVESDGDVQSISSFRSRASSVTLIDEPTDNFTSVPPPGAFPECYPPSAEKYLFPCRDGDFSMAQPVWRRKPVSHMPEPEVPSEDVLTSVIESFERLELTDEQAMTNTHDSSRHTATAHSVSPFIVKPLPAPLPFLVHRLQAFTSSIFSTRSGGGDTRQPEHCTCKCIGTELPRQEQSPTPQRASAIAATQSELQDKEKARHTNNIGLAHSDIQSLTGDDAFLMDSTTVVAGTPCRSESPIGKEMAEMAEMALTSFSRTGESNPSHASWTSMPLDTLLRVPPILGEVASDFDLSLAFLDMPNFADLLSCSQEAGGAFPWGDLDSELPASNLT